MSLTVSSTNSNLSFVTLDRTLLPNGEKIKAILAQFLANPKEPPIKSEKTYKIHFRITYPTVQEDALSIANYQKDRIDPNNFQPLNFFTPKYAKQPFAIAEIRKEEDGQHVLAQYLCPFTELSSAEETAKSFLDDSWTVQVLSSQEFRLAEIEKIITVGKTK